mmetsp:Transcript_22264/g.41744  ORF Transcript_22264/g.41744 Transcript_22264/m.41744 type:complete len:527 (+) Transcript_22264:311-1891(+)
MEAVRLEEGVKQELKHALDVEKRVNPFEVNVPWTPWELFKALIGIVLVPVRFLMAVICMIFLAFFCELAVSFGFDKTKPMGTFRKIVMSPMPYLSRLMMFIFGYWWVSVKGKPVKKKEAPIFVLGPHSTFMDSFLTGYLLGPTTGLAKDSVERTPLFGSVARAGQIISVKRDDPNGRKNALDEFVRRARTTEENWRQLFVFPEGTCTNRKALIKFKRGAFVPGMPIQPIIYRWPNHFFDPAWTGSANRLGLILRLLSQFYNRVHVEFLPVYYPTEEEKADPDLFAENVRQLMASKLGIPTTDHSYEDSFLAMAARKNKANVGEVANFEYVKAKLLNIDLKEAKRLLRVFAVDSKVRKTGHMNVAQFAKALKLPLTEPLVEVFDLLDSEGVGFIDYKSFLIGLSFISQNITNDESIDLFFAALDPEGTGKIDEAAFNNVLTRVFQKPNRKMAAGLFKAASDESGFVDREKLKSFLLRRPELLVFGLAFTNKYKEDHEAIPNLQAKKVLAQQKTKASSITTVTSATSL